MHASNLLHKRNKQRQQTNNTSAKPSTTVVPITAVPTNSSNGAVSHTRTITYADVATEPEVISRVDHSSSTSRGLNHSSRRVTTGTPREGGRNQIGNEQIQNQNQNQNQKPLKPTHLHTRINDSRRIQAPIAMPAAAVTPTPVVAPVKDGRNAVTSKLTVGNRSSESIVPRPNSVTTTVATRTIHKHSQEQSQCDRYVQHGTTTAWSDSPTTGGNASINLDQRAVGDDPRRDSLGGIGDAETDTDRKKQQTKNEDEDAFEYRQAKFLADVRETEDVQDLIEAELRTTNHRFAEHYALLLRDLDAAVDLLDKLEAIEEAAEDVLTRYN